MNEKKLTNDNFIAFALYNYFSDEHINVEEFTKSLKTLTYINRLLKKDNNVNHRLILNHFIITANTFGVKPTVEMLLFKISKDKHIKVNTYLHFLNYLSDETIELDKELLQLLGEL